MLTGGSSGGNVIGGTGALTGGSGTRSGEIVGNVAVGRNVDVRTLGRSVGVRMGTNVGLTG